MIEADPNPMPHFDVLPRCAAIARFIFRMPRCLSPISDHEFRHPLDPPLEPVTDWPEPHAS